MKLRFSKALFYLPNNPIFYSKIAQRQIILPIRIFIGIQNIARFFAFLLAHFAKIFLPITFTLDLIAVICSNLAKISSVIKESLAKKESC